MEARATKRYLRGSPRKMRLVIDMIRGRNAFEALTLLNHSPKHAAKEAALVLKSAIANLSNKSVDEQVTPGGMIVKEAFVNQGPAMKRLLPAPMGRAYRVRKRSNHVTIVVSTL